MFGMGTGGSSSLQSPKSCSNSFSPAQVLGWAGGGNMDGPHRTGACALARKARRELEEKSAFYGQAERAISTG